MMKKFLLLAIYLISFTITFSQPKKVALLFGISEYNGDFAPLHTSEKDSKVMGLMLEALGFETPLISSKDANRDDLVKLLKKFESTAKHADVALFYFSGHGASKMNRGDSIPDMYLVPSGDYKISGSTYNDFLELENIRKTLEQTGAKLKICIIDACRNSFDNKGTYHPGEIIEEEFMRSINKLPRVKGTIYFFSASNGEKSIVGDGPLSVFTSAFVNHLGETDNMEVIWKRIQNDVSELYPTQRPECFIADASSENDKKTIILENNFFNKDNLTINVAEIIKQVAQTTILIDNHECVDLGLPSGTLWATCNVGANSPEDYGNYFVWGGIKPKTKKVSDYYEQMYLKDKKKEDDELLLGDDTAYQNWGGLWRMPTKIQCDELIKNCTWTLGRQKGVRGYKVTGPNGNSIFLPLAGYYAPAIRGLQYAGIEGYYYTKTHNSGPYAAILDAGSSDVRSHFYNYRCSVRPVFGVPVQSLRKHKIIN